jgi:hypothetical protein
MRRLVSLGSTEAATTRTAQEEECATIPPMYSNPFVSLSACCHTSIPHPSIATIALGLLLSQISNISVSVSVSLYTVQIQHLRSLRKKICQSGMKALRRGKNKPVVGVVSRSAAMCVTCHLLGVPLRSSSPIGTDDDTPPFFSLLRNFPA